MSDSPPVRPSSAARPHRPSPHVDATLMLQQQAAASAGGSAQKLRPRAHSSASGSISARGSGGSQAPDSPSFHFTFAHQSHSPELMSARDGSHAPPTTPMPRSMAMAHTSAPFSEARPRAATSQALFRPHSSATHERRSYHNTPDSSPSVNGWSSVPRRGKHERANSALGGSGGGALSPSPLLFAPNLAQASPMMLPSRGQSFGDPGALDEGADGSEEEDAEAESAAFATPRSFRHTPLTQSPVVGSSAAAPLSPVANGASGPAPKSTRASPPFQCSVCGASFSAKGSLVRHEAASHPAIAQSRLDEQDESDRDSDSGDEPQRASQPDYSSHTHKSFASHPELPFAMKDVARNASPSASASTSAPGTDVHSNPFLFAAPPAAGRSGFSPRHAHWSPATEWDERYAVEASDDDGQASVQGSPVRRSPPAVEPRIQMSPATRSASDQLVPALSWLLILTRKLVLSGAVTVAQGRHVKREVLAANPRLLSAVDRFVSKEDPNAIVEALLNCLPSVEEGEEKQPQQQQAQRPPSSSVPFVASQGRSVNDSDSFDGDDLGEEEEAEGLRDSDSDAEYEAILGRGPGGHKSKSNQNGAGSRLAGSGGGGWSASASDSAAESDDEENVLMVVNSLLPLDLPRLESLHGLLREMGFSLIDLETLSLCTSTLLPTAPRELIGGVGSSPSPSPSGSSRDAGGEQQSVAPVSLSAWQLCIKSLRLHSNAPKLFTQLLEAIFLALDLNATHSVPYGELIATVAVFCRAASHRQRLQFIFNSIQRSSATGAERHAAFGEPSLAATAAYGFIFSASLAIHVFLGVATLQLECGQAQSQALTPAQLQSVSSSVGVHNAQVWTLTNAIYALFDRQFGAQHAAAATAAAAAASPDDAAEVPDVSYSRWLTWKWHPSFVLENLLQG